MCHTTVMSGPKAAKIIPHQNLVRARGLQLHLTRWHRGRSGTPLLFLNGLGADAHAAAPLLRRITGREVWTIDMPGTGSSPDCFWPYSLASMAETVMDVVRQFTNGPIDLAGFSWGGALAQQITGQFPDRVENLILLATASHLSAADLGWGAAFDRDIQKNGLRLPVATPLGLTYQSLALAGWSSDILSSRIGAHPILLLSGDRDQVVPQSYGWKLAERLNNPQHLIVDGGHLFPFAKARETSALIQEFLDQQWDMRMAAMPSSAIA